MLTDKQYQDLALDMLRYCKQYYLYPDHGECEISDQQYDQLNKSLEAYEAANPNKVLPVSPAGKVAGGVYGEVEQV